MTALAVFLYLVGLAQMHLILETFKRETGTEIPVWEHAVFVILYPLSFPLTLLGAMFVDSD